MRGYVLSPRAQADIEEIWQYTTERWGHDQAERYIHALKQAIETIAREPSRGRASEHIRPGYRRYSVGSHVLFFRMVDGEIDLVRVLHQRMDFDRHL